MTDEHSTEGYIVVGVDGSEASKRALQWAEQQAKMTGSRLRIVTTWEFPTMYGEGMIGIEGLDFAADAKALLERVTSEVLDPDSGVQIDAVVVEGHPAPVLCEEAKAADLVVVGSRGRGEFTGMLIGSVSEFLATHAPCPVVIIRGSH